MKLNRFNISKYFASEKTPLPNPHMTLDQCFDIIAYRHEQFDQIKIEMPEIADDAEKFFTELERRVELKKKEMGV